MHESLLFFTSLGRGKNTACQKRIVPFSVLAQEHCLRVQPLCGIGKNAEVFCLMARACAYGENYLVCCISYGLAQLSPGGRCFEAPFPVGAEPGLAADAQ